jgi:hypothetical protein
MLKLNELCVGVSVSLMLASAASAAVNFTGSAISENFDGLPTVDNNGAFSATAGVQSPVSGSIFDGAKILTTSSNTMNLLANAGGTNTAAIYSFGSGTSTERALGMIASGTTTPGIGLEIVNAFAGNAITGFTITYRQENWRTSTLATNTNIFAYGTDAFTGLTSANYISSGSGMITLTSLNAVGPGSVASNGPIDGNNPTNQANRSGSVTGLSILPGGRLFLRWQDVNDNGNDAGLAIDDFNISFTTQSLNTPPTFTGEPYEIVLDYGNNNLPQTGSVTVNAGDAETAQSLVISEGAIPLALAGKLTVGTQSGTNPASKLYTVNLLPGDVGLIGSTFSIPLSVSDGTATDTSGITVRVIPEPTALAGVAALTLLTARRRR